MHFQSFLVRLAVLSVLICGTAWAASPLLRDIAVREDFEDAPPNVTKWASNGPSTVHFSGMTDEQAFSGERAFKFDVTIDGGTYHYFGAPMRMPAEGSLKMTAQVFVAEGTTARVGFGTNMLYPPTHHSGCSPVETFEGPTGEWRLVEFNLSERGRTGAHTVIGRQTATLSGADVGWELDRWSLFILGGEGKRAVVYVDDIRVEGQGYSEGDYETILEHRWTDAQDRLESAWLADWREQLAGARERLGALDALPDFLLEDAEAVRGSVAEAEGLIETIAERGYASHDPGQPARLPRQRAIRKRA